MQVQQLQNRINALTKAFEIRIRSGATAAEMIEGFQLIKKLQVELDNAKA